MFSLIIHLQMYNKKNESSKFLYNYFYFFLIQPFKTVVKQKHYSTKKQMPEVLFYNQAYASKA